jgi:hypothetical protein
VPELTADSIVVRRSEPLSAPIDDDLVLLDPKAGMYYGTDHVGQRVWALIERPTSVRELCATLSGEFEVEPQRCEEEVAHFLLALAQADLIEVRS